MANKLETCSKLLAIFWDFAVPHWRDGNVAQKLHALRTQDFPSQ